MKWVNYWLELAWILSSFSWGADVVMVSPLPRSGDLICNECPLIIPGRRYRLPGYACRLSSARRNNDLAPSFRRHPASKQKACRSNYIFQASVKHLVWLAWWAEPEANLHSSSCVSRFILPTLCTLKKKRFKSIIGNPAGACASKRFLEEKKTRYFWRE